MPYTVLFVGGTPDLRQAVARTLKGEQVETLCTDDGWTALCLLNENTPDLLVADTNLPHKNGADLCRYVRAEPEFRSMPVVLFDSRSGAANQKLAIMSGADVYLSEPFSPREMLKCIRTLLTKDKRVGGLAQAEPAALSRQLPPESSVQSAPVTRPQVRNRKVLALWSLLAGATIVAILLTDPGLKYTPGDRTASRQFSTGESVRDADAGQIILRAEGTHANRAASDTKTGVELPASKGDAGTDVAKGKAEEPDLQATPQANPAPALKEPSARQKGNAPSQAPPAVVPRNDPPVAGVNPPSSPPALARNLRVPHTIHGHLRRSGEEMKEAALHFGSGTKHFGEGAGEVAVGAGKKVVRGVKRLGGAIKKIF